MILISEHAVRFANFFMGCFKQVINRGEGVVNMEGFRISNFGFRVLKKYRIGDCPFKV